MSQELVDRAVKGDADALSELLKLHGPKVRGRLTGKISTVWRSVLDEDDVMQVTYMEAFLRIGRFTPAGEPDASFVAWLSRIAENNLKDAVKELERAKRPDPRHRVKPATAEDSYVGLVEMLGATSGTPSRVAAKGEAVRAIEAGLSQLPKDYAEVIRRYDLDGRSPQEVGEMLKRSPGAVFMLRARAHDRLKDLMGRASQFFSQG